MLSAPEKPSWVAEPLLTGTPERESCKLLVCPSYEDRSLLSLQRVLQIIKPTECVILGFKQYESETELFDNPRDVEVAQAYKKSYDSIVKLAEQEGAEIIKRWGDLEDPAMTLKDVDLSSEDVVDITCFPRNYLWALLNLDWAKNCRLAYSKVGTYEEDEEMFAVGVRSINCLDGYEGIVRNQATILCLMLGFEGHRAMSIFRRYDPYRTLAFVTANHPDLGNTVRLNNAQLLGNTTVQEFVVDGSSPDAFLADFVVGINSFLVTEGAMRDEFDFVVSALGPKPQILGLHSLYHRLFPFHLVYAVPTKRRICSHDIGESLVYRRRTTS